MLCYYGCGSESVVIFKNGKGCCSDKKERCPAFSQKRTESRKNNGNPWVSDSTKQKIKESLTGKTVPMHVREKISASTKGTHRQPMSAEAKQKMIETKKNNPKAAWNKGLSKDTDPRVELYSNKQRGQLRTGNYKPNSFFKDANPWQGKNRSKENSPRYNGEIYNRELKDYRNKVLWLTEQTYTQLKGKINPNNYTRAVAGQADAWHLDHIYPISKGFDYNIPVELIASADNLRMVYWRDNIIKSNTLTEELIPESIKQFIKDN